MLQNYQEDIQFRITKGFFFKTKSNILLVEMKLHGPCNIGYTGKKNEILQQAD